MNDLFRMNKIFVLSVLLAVALMPLTGCTSFKAAIAMNKSTDDFLSLEQDSRIKYEEGSVKFAKEIAPHLDSAIQTVESKQGALKKSAVIYVTKSIDSFSSYCASKHPSACVSGDRLFISPKLFQHKDRLLGVLTHELAHFQLTQDIGFWDYQTNLPVWFKEGLAVYISNGSGAEKVTEQEAIEAINQGKTIKPNGSGSLLFRKTASSFNLKTHMFYRQSGMFVKWLHDKSPNKFRKLLASFKQGKTLNEALSSIYSFDADQGWGKFISEIKHNKRVNSDWQKRLSLSGALLFPAGYA